jgi:hypothetical protein
MRIGFSILPPPLRLQEAPFQELSDSLDAPARELYDLRDASLRVSALLALQLLLKLRCVANMSD